MGYVMTSREAERGNKMLYGYRINIWNGIKHNGKYSHVTERVVFVRLPNKMNDADVVLASRVVLEPATETKVHDGLTITTSGEYVKSVYFLGVATSRVVWDYKLG